MLAPLCLEERKLLTLYFTSTFLGREMRDAVETKELEDLAKHQLAKLGSSSLQSSSAVLVQDKKEVTTEMIMQVNIH